MAAKQSGGTNGREDDSGGQERKYHDVLPEEHETCKLHKNGGGNGGARVND